jgi:hypothetical protein
MWRMLTADVGTSASTPPSWLTSGVGPRLATAAKIAWVAQQRTTSISLP